MKYDKLTLIGKLKTAYDLLNEAAEEEEFANLNSLAKKMHNGVLCDLFILIKYTQNRDVE